MDLYSTNWAMVVAGEVDVAAVADWTRWYDERHLPEILSCPGFQRATRWVADGDGTHHFVTLYEAEDPSVMESPEFAERRGLGPFAGQVRAQTRLYSHHLTLAAGSLPAADR